MTKIAEICKFTIVLCLIQLIYIILPDLGVLVLVFLDLCKFPYFCSFHILVSTGSFSIFLLSQ